jgi:hypothetical protein
MLRVYLGHLIYPQKPSADLPNLVSRETIPLNNISVMFIDHYGLNRK